jgi:hypothetical protein
MPLDDTPQGSTPNEPSREEMIVRRAIFTCLSHLPTEDSKLRALMAVAADLLGVDRLAIVTDEDPANWPQ